MPRLVSLRFAFLALALFPTPSAAQRPPRKPSLAERPKSLEAPKTLDTVNVFIERDAAPNRVFLEAVVDVRPEILSGPPIVYPDLLRQAGIQGRVVVQTIIDTTGRAEPASIRIIQSPNPGFNQPVTDYILGAKFRPARVKGSAVRVLVNLPIDFSIRTPATPR